MRVFLDDIRTPPEGVFDVIVRNAEDCIEILKNCDVSYISLDHDLGDGKKTGYDVVLFIEQEQMTGGKKFSKIGWCVHSQNPVGAAVMRSVLKRVLDYWEQG